MDKLPEDIQLMIYRRQHEMEYIDVINELNMYNPDLFYDKYFQTEYYRMRHIYNDVDTFMDELFPTYYKCFWHRDSLFYFLFRILPDYSQGDLILNVITDYAKHNYEDYDYW